MNKAAIDSYIRNLVGQVVGALFIVTQTSGIASPLYFTTAEWLLVANVLWAALIPTALRWINKNDPAFGRIAKVAAEEVGKKLEAEAAKAKKSPAKKPAAKKPAAKAPAKKPAARKPAAKKK